MSDLDSFFAKKDKKKGKSGKKFATTDEIAKKLEDVSIKKDKVVKKDKLLPSNPDDKNGINENEDEWKEYQEDKKDYSGLKLQPLKLSDTNSLDSDKDNELNEDGTECGEHGKKKAMGPWKIGDPENKTVEEIVPPSQPSNPTGTYVCPRIKTQAMEPMHGGRLREQLDVNSTTAFPTLDAAKPGSKVTESAWTKKRVEPEPNPEPGAKMISLSAATAHESKPNSYVPPYLRGK